MIVKILNNKNTTNNVDNIVKLFKKRFEIISNRYPPSLVKEVVFCDEKTSQTNDKLFIDINLLYKALKNLNYLNLIDNIFIDAIRG